ncbi:hypothetical protein DFH09DRAFT_1039373, partial [Mycena vulgaris]
MTTTDQDRTSPPYVYYLVYARDGAIIRSRTALDPTNPFIGRIKASSVPPPLTAGSLKRTLAHAEGIPDPSGSRTSLYQSPTDQAPMKDSQKVAIHGIGIASTPATALALIFVAEVSEAEKDGYRPINSASYLPQYIYYHLHTLSGDDSSAHAFDPSEAAVGRIERMVIPPSADVLTFQRCIAKHEGKPVYAFGDLYADVQDKCPQANKARMTLGAEFRGSTAKDALRLVQPMGRPGLPHRRLKITLAQSAFWAADVCLRFQCFLFAALSLYVCPEDPDSLNWI